MAGVKWRKNIILVYMLTYSFAFLPLSIPHQQDLKKPGGNAKWGNFWQYLLYFFIFCVPSHARSLVRWVKQSPQSATVSWPDPKASCRHWPDGNIWHLKMSKMGQDCRMCLGVWGPVQHGHLSKWNFQFVEVGEEMTVSSSQSKDCDLSCSVQLVDAVLFIFIILTQSCHGFHNHEQKDIRTKHSPTNAISPSDCPLWRPAVPWLLTPVSPWWFTLRPDGWASLVNEGCLSSWTPRSRAGRRRSCERGPRSSLTGRELAEKLNAIGCICSGCRAVVLAISVSCLRLDVGKTFRMWL